MMTSRVAVGTPAVQFPALFQSVFSAPVQEVCARAAHADIRITNRAMSRISFIVCGVVRFEPSSAVKPERAKTGRARRQETPWGRLPVAVTGLPRGDPFRPKKRRGPCLHGSLLFSVLPSGNTNVHD